MKKRKQNRRNAAENPELQPRFSLKSRAELVEVDYLHKLSAKELKWLNKFNRESISATFEEDGNLHKTKKLKKSCYDRNNSRNRDILTRAKASNQLVDYEELHGETNINDYEDYIVEKLDQKDAIEAVEWLANELGKDENDLEEKLIDGTEKTYKSKERK